ncbi:hypothetical protein [Lentzea jiangxiensis]|uniref:NADH:flavin oxidoreductase / NADH oxidase family protein n=1 Tax=Lentzea jiangxiensis TaxID=641025 RepID=A0A1H0LXB7_9PSEU|nr:hypothetical protein [Lentzea jiangxiensis]SDO72862.1 NADH:flavin oxidoreductase / NADH oxidase family protein [Lentzea jiangxiensis]
MVQDLRRISGSPLIVNTGFSSVTDRRTAADLVGTGQADAVAVGRAAIANPDLPRRWQADRPEAFPDQTTFYSGGATGYTDYPVDDVPDGNSSAGRLHR